MKILFVTPAVEEQARGIGYILRSLIASANQSGYNCGVLTGHPLPNSKQTNDDELPKDKEKFILNEYLASGDRMFGDIIPGGLSRKNVLESLLKGNIFRVSETKLPTPNDLPISGLSFAINSPFFYKHLMRNHSFLIRKVIKKIISKFDIDMVVAVSPSTIRSKDTAPAKLIHFVHDIIPLEMGNIHNNKAVARFRKAIMTSINNSDQILVNSKDTAKKIQQFCIKKNKKNNVNVVYGISSVRNINNQTYLEAKYGVKPKKFLFFLSTLEKRKNLKKLIEGYTLIADKIDMPLLLVGEPGDGFAEIDKLHRSLPKSIKAKVLFGGRVNETEKSLLYRDAFAFVFPSLYEGLGLGVIEAMQYGLPVITTRCGGLSEAAGDAALFIDNPSDEKEIAKKIMDLINNSVLYFELVQKGTDWAKNFSSSKFQERFSNVLTDMNKINLASK